MQGHLAEGRGSNLFLVRDGALVTPRDRSVLPGISRQTVIEIAAELGIPCREADLDLYDAYAADEAFLTSTSLCLCPVRSVNGMQNRRRGGVRPGDAAPDPGAILRSSTVTSSTNIVGICDSDWRLGPAATPCGATGTRPERKRKGGP